MVQSKLSSPKTAFYDVLCQAQKLSSHRIQGHQWHQRSSNHVDNDCTRSEWSASRNEINVGSDWSTRFRLFSFSSLEHIQMCPEPAHRCTTKCNRCSMGWFEKKNMICVIIVISFLEQQVLTSFLFNSRQQLYNFSTVSSESGGERWLWHQTFNPMNVLLWI